MSPPLLLAWSTPLIVTTLVNAAVALFLAGPPEAAITIFNDPAVERTIQPAHASVWLRGQP
jgi:hypothetical protein